MTAKETQIEIFQRHIEEFYDKNPKAHSSDIPMSVFCAIMEEYACSNRLRYFKKGYNAALEEIKEVE